MFRANRLIAVLTAIFVLHAPLCALACAPSAAPAAPAAPAASAADLADSRVGHSRSAEGEPERSRSMSKSKSGSRAEATEMAMARPGAPCHEPARPATPGEPAESHDDCHCEVAATAVLVSLDLTFSKVQIPPTLASKSFEAIPAVVIARTRQGGPNQADLPPPDILLLKSTLLL